MRRTLLFLASRSPNPAPAALRGDTDKPPTPPPQTATAAKRRGASPPQPQPQPSVRAPAKPDAAASVEVPTTRSVARSASPPRRASPAGPAVGSTATTGARSSTATTPRRRSPSGAAAAPQGGMLGGGKRNRILMMCTALGEKDTPQWPFWKWQHIKATRGVTDFAMLAVTREDSFIATIKDGVASTRALRRSLKTVDRRLLSAFLDEHYAGPSSWFVYGGHGVSDLLEFDHDHRMQVHELAATLGDRKFTGMLFDACLMSSLDTAYYLRNNTRYVGASEGYMWEEDTWAENHMFNPYSAALMARDGNGKRVLKLIGEEYTRKSSMADFTVIDTKYAAPLWNRVQNKHLASMHSQVKLRPEVASGAEPVLLEDYDEVDPKVGYAGITNVDKVNTHMPATFPPARTKAGYLVPRDHTHRFNYEFPHSLFPAEQPDDHIVDLGCYVDSDPDTQALLRKVVAWHDGPSNKSVYSPKSLSGLNFSFSQYSYSAARKAATTEEAVTLGEHFELAGQALEAPVEPLRLTPRAKKSRKARKQKEQQSATAATATVAEAPKVVTISGTTQSSFHAVSAGAAPAPAATSVRQLAPVAPVARNRSTGPSPLASSAGKAVVSPASARAPTPPRP